MQNDVTRQCSESTSLVAEKRAHEITLFLSEETKFYVANFISAHMNSDATSSLNNYDLET